MKPYWDNGVARLYEADAREIPLPDGSVHCVVTSPPYWGLRDYGLGDWQGGDSGCGHESKVSDRQAPHGLDDRAPETAAYGGNAREPWPSGVCGLCGATQAPAGIGLEPTIAEHLENLVAVFRELRRVLRDDGTVWLNYGDAYASNQASGGASPDGPRDGRANAAIAHDAIPRGTGSGLAPKQLMGLPWRVAFALQDDGAASITEMRALERVMDGIADAYGEDPPPDKVLAVLERLHGEYAEAKGDSWWVRSAIVWHKPNPMPESVRDRPTNAYEMIFLLSKSPRYFYDAEAIRQPHAEGTIERFGKNPMQSSRQKFGDEGSVRANKSFHESTPNGLVGGANARNVWTIPTQGRPDAHFATFPDELPRRCILAGTSERGVCAECGAPWERVVEASGGTIGESWHDHNEDAVLGQRTGGMNLETDRGTGAYRRETLGWRPTCDHDGDPVPAIVLDPFVGSGTTVAVAQALGRRGVGLDLNPEYLAIAQRRIGAVPLPMF